MQLYAADHAGNFVAARWAHTKKKYRCLECDGEVRVRRGGQRRAHFFHIRLLENCASAGKGAIHLHIQETIRELLPENEACLEVPFKAIRRIADVVWENKKVVFEVQCSPISGDEIKKRIADYQKVGYQVIWILHLDRYGKSKLTSAELALQPYTHYYTDLGWQGQGHFYDSCAVLVSRHVCWKTPLIPITLSKLGETMHLDPCSIMPKELKLRKQAWRMHCEGDWLDLFCKEDSIVDLKRVLNLWPRTEPTRWGRCKQLITRYICHPYRLVFQILLEQSCRRQS